MRPFPRVNYTADLDCQNYKTRAFAPNGLSHTIYLDIMYTKAVDILSFFKGVGIANEVSRGPDKSTICRLIIGNIADRKIIFFDVNKARKIPSDIDAVQEAELNKVDPNADADAIVNSENSSVGGGLFSSSTVTKLSKSLPKFGGPVAEDVKMTNKSFKNLIQQMVPLTGELCPKNGKIIDPFNDDEISPDLSCPTNKFGGRGKQKIKTKKTKKNKKNKKNKKHKTRRH